MHPDIWYLEDRIRYLIGEGMVYRFKVNNTEDIRPIVNSNKVYMNYSMNYNYARVNPNSGFLDLPFPMGPY